MKPRPPSSQNTPITRVSLILRLNDAGCIQAWEEFVEIYQPLLRSLAAKYGLQPADRDDVVQEVLTRVAKNIESWEPDNRNASFRRWLTTIARNQTIEFFRASRRQHSQVSDWHDIQQNTLNEDVFDLEHAGQVFIWAARHIQSNFEMKTWKAFWMTAVNGIPTAECADQLQMNIASVYMVRSRVMKMLRQTVRQSEFEQTPIGGDCEQY